MWIIKEVLERQEAKVNCAFQEELDSGDMLCVPSVIVEERNRIREIQDEDISNF